jgi:5-methylcytosine-specific restriction endonuclease McrA
MSNFPWVKLWLEGPDDPKFQAAADMAGSTPASAWYAWCKSLTHAGGNDPRGTITGLHPQVIASYCRITVEEVKRIFQAFRELRMLIGDRIANWVKRQTEKLPKPRSANAERVARWREKQEAACAQGNFEFASGAAAPAPEVESKPADDQRTANAKRQQRWRERRRAAGLPVLIQGAQATRQRIWERDQFTCRYCGSKDGPFHCDHVIPRSRGGSDDDDNLITSCIPCNTSKGRFTVSEWVATGLAPACVMGVTSVTPLQSTISAVAEEEKDSNSEAEASEREPASAEIVQIANHRKETKVVRGHRKSRISADWQPDDQDRGFAYSKGYDDAWIEEQAAACRDYSLAHGKMYADFHAYWRTWVGRAERFANAARSPAGHRSEPPSILAAARAALAYGGMDPFQH